MKHAQNIKAMPASNEDVSLEGPGGSLQNPPAREHTSAREGGIGMPCRQRPRIRADMMTKDSQTDTTDQLFTAAHLTSCGAWNPRVVSRVVSTVLSS